MVGGGARQELEHSGSVMEESRVHAATEEHEAGRTPHPGCRKHPTFYISTDNLFSISMHFTFVPNLNSSNDSSTSWDLDWGFLPKEDL